MRRGTPSAIAFGQYLCRVRKVENMTMTQMAKKIGCPPATISQIERGERSLKESKLAVWAAALNVDFGIFQDVWAKYEKQSEADPPIVRTRKNAIPGKDLEKLFLSLTSPEKQQVLGYIHCILDQRGE